MDTSTEYIKMCKKAEEFQNKEFFFKEDFQGTEFVPSEAGLRDLLLIHLKGDARALIHKICDFVANGIVVSVLENKNPVVPEGGVEFLLKLYMYTAFSKRWCPDSEDWI